MRSILSWLWGAITITCWFLANREENELFGLFLLPAIMGSCAFMWWFIDALWKAENRQK